MVKRCIGIDIGPSHLHAIQVVRTDEKFHIERVFTTAMRRATDLPSAILRTLISQHGFDRRANVAISMPYDAVFFRNLGTDAVGLEQISSHNPSVLENDFPIRADEIVARICSHHQLPDERHCILAAAVSKTSLQERLDILSEAKIHPVLVDAAIFAIHSTVEVNHPEITRGAAVIAFINESHLTLAVTQNNKVLIVRNIPVVSCTDNNVDTCRRHIAELLSDETEITWRKVFKSEIEENTKIYLATSADVPADLGAIVEENLHCQVVVVEPCARVKSSPEYKTDVTMCVAEGLALRLLASEKTVGVNFAGAIDADVKSALNLKREFAIYAALAGAIAVVVLAGLFIRLSLLETKYAHIKNEIKQIFQRTLPNETNIINPLVQMDQKLRSLQRDYALFGSAGGVGPVEVLHTVTTSIPLEINIALDDMLVTSESVRLRGIAQSFESVYNWQRQLQDRPHFSTVDVQDIRMEPKSGLVHFTISTSLAMVEQK
jgi:Tfp pilus assembly PilM family ATPase